MSPAIRQWHRPSTLRRVVAGTLDVAAWLGGLYALWSADVLALDAWLTPTDTLPWPESAAVRLAQAPGSAARLLLTLWAPMIGWHLVWGPLTGASPGAWCMGLRWVDADGEPAPAWRLVVRALAYALWPLTAFAAPWTVWIARDGQGLHDWVAGVWCVDRWRATPVSRMAPAAAPTVFVPPKRPTGGPLPGDPLAATVAASTPASTPALDAPAPEPGAGPVPPAASDPD